jgi:hypothetical protein
LWATRANARVAVGLSTPVISNITVPGFTRGDAAGLDLAGGDPPGLGRLQAEVAERHRVAAARVALHLAALAFAELHPLGHHWHGTPTSISNLKLGI